ncbi:DUF3489 domain-containing protein [Methylobacterium sp. NEAU 140]|uniref:DUF3489 domain-containing protein n=1 Tax=Methylobacterium sp. NEAU 140 TaxID=3064945 RepID=UPI0027357A8F|nr:DUF3489 domain-containing protein [Methylobacterium sp. NEAU 140]MDP4026656.1 DUF3489 domain-containing protein [Methylobacterium sp. NEAU 140]
MPDPSPLSPIHRALVEAARRHPDHWLVPPERVRGGARRRLGEKLVALGLAELARHAEAAWWVDPNHGPTGLRLGPGERGDGPTATVAGHADDRMAMERDSPADLAAASSPASRSPTEPAPGGGGAFTMVVSPSPAEPRSWTKIARVLALLRRPEGVDLAALVAATGWLPHTARAALTGLRRKGHAMAACREDGRTVYRIGAESGPVTETESEAAAVVSAAAVR